MNNRKTRFATVTLIQTILFLSIVCLIILFNSMILRQDVCVYCISIIIVLCFIFSIWSWWQITGRIFDPFILFLVAAMLFTGGQALIEVFFIKPAANFDIYNKTQSTTVLLALFLVALGLFSFQSGGITAALLRSKRKGDICPPASSDLFHLRFDLRMIGWILLVISIIPTINEQTASIKAVFSGGYSAFFQVERGIGLEGTGRILSIFFIPGVLFLLAGSKEKPFSLFISAFFISAYVTMQFFIGSRMLAAMPLLAYGWLWHRTIRPFPRAFLVVFGVVFLFIIFPAISVYRVTAGSVRISTPSLLWQTFFSIDNPIVAIISEMASTIFTVVRTLELVPAVRPYSLGSSYFYSLYSLIPNLFWSFNPASANELAKWLTVTISPEYAAMGGGYGFSFVAEAYLNFGWFGMPIVLFLIGYAYARFVLWASESGNPVKMAFLASFSSFFYIFARGEFSSMPRYFVWYSLFPYVLTLIISKVRPGVKKRIP